MNDADASLLWEQFCRTGDPTAFEKLYDAYHDEVLRFCRAVLREDRAAEEVANSTFAELYLRRPAIRRAFRKMLYAWTSKLCLRYEKDRASSGTAVSVVEPGGRDPPAAEQDEIDAAIGPAVSRLPPAERHVFILRAALGFTSSEIAEMLDTSRWTVVRRYNRACRRLRDDLGRL